MERLKDFFADKNIQHVLDIGTGAGDFIKILKNIFTENTKITGVDPSKEALDQARANDFGKFISFKQMEGEALQFSGHSFDVVCISNALHHLEDVKKTLEEMKRVVKKDGWLLIAEIASDELNLAQENQKMLHHLKSYVDRKNGITHKETWTKDEILQIVESNDINPIISFPFNRMSEPVFDSERLNEWVERYKGHLSQLSDYPDWVISSDLFQERVFHDGFQLADQLVIIGKI